MVPYFGPPCTSTYSFLDQELIPYRHHSSCVLLLVLLVDDGATLFKKPKASSFQIKSYYLDEIWQDCS